MGHKIFQIDTSIKDTQDSYTRQTGQYFIRKFQERFGQLEVSYLDLAKNPPSYITAEWYNAAMVPPGERSVKQNQILLQPNMQALRDCDLWLFDLAGLKGYDLDSFDYEGSDTEDYYKMNFTESMFRICVYITDYIYRDEPAVILNEIFAFCKDRKIDIFWHIEQKMRYNELRTYNMSTDPEMCIEICVHQPYRRGMPHGKCHTHYRYNGKVYKSVEALLEAIND